jgi:hypothetical protein
MNRSLQPTFPIHHTSSRHRTQASDPIQRESTSLAVTRACLAAPTFQSCSCHLHNDEPRPFPRHQPLPPRIASLRSVAASATLHQWWWHTEPLDSLKDGREQIARHRYLGHLEDHVASVRDDLRTYLDQLLPQRDQRPLLNTPWPGQPKLDVKDEDEGALLVIGLADVPDAVKK